DAVAKSADAGLVRCAQPYDSVTQVIGPAGGLIAVGHHYLWVDTMALADTVRITAVAPADTVRWVRFQPDGLQFRTNGAGRSAILYTTYKDCGVPTSDTLRIAQVTDSLGVLGYLETYVQIRRRSWSQGNQYVYGVLHHFSQYAVSWENSHCTASTLCASVLMLCRWPSCWSLRDAPTRPVRLPRGAQRRSLQWHCR